MAHKVVSTICLQKVCCANVVNGSQIRLWDLRSLENLTHTFAMHSMLLNMNHNVYFFEIQECYDINIKHKNMSTNLGT